jgi:hypothetical protein
MDTVYYVQALEQYKSENPHTPAEFTAYVCSIVLRRAQELKQAHLDYLREGF